MKNNLKILIVLITLVSFIISCGSDDSKEDISPQEIVLDASDFIIKIDENPIANQNLGNIVATTNRGDVTFSLLEQKPDEAFILDENTGRLTVLDSSLFDYEINPELNGIVRVSNGIISKNINIMITLIDLNEEVIDPRLLWQKNLYDSGGREDNLLSIFQTVDGNYMIGGTFSFPSGGPEWFSRMTKINNSGEILWDKTLDRSLTRMNDIKETSDNGYVVACTTIVNEDWISSYIVNKFDSNGNLQWSKIIGGSNNDQLRSIEETNDGGYIIGGSSESNISGDKIENNYGEVDFWVLKLNGSGEIEWQKTIGGSNIDALNSVLQTIDGGFIVAGSSNSDASGDKTENSRGGYDFWVLKLNDSGEIEWQKTIGGSNRDEITSVKLESDNSFLIAGNSSSDISGEKLENSKGLVDYWLVKMSSNGEIVWQKTIGGNNDDNLRSFTKTLDNGYVLAGYSLSNSSGDKKEDIKGKSDYWLVKINPSGSIEWENTIGGDNLDNLNSVLQDSDGTFILGGDSYSGISGDKTTGIVDHHYWIIKHSNNL